MGANGGVEFRTSAERAPGIPRLGLLGPTPSRTTATPALGATLVGIRPSREFWDFEFVPPEVPVVIGDEEVTLGNELDLVAPGRCANDLAPGILDCSVRGCPDDYLVALEYIQGRT